MARYIDLDYKFNIDTTGNISTNKDIAVIKQSIKSILSTYPGERYMLPEFGSYIKTMLFEPMDAITRDSIKTEIRNAIGRWEPRVSIKNVNIKESIDQHVYDISIDFTINSTGQLDRFEGKVKTYN